MHFARVIGTVVCSTRVASWAGHRTLLLQPTDSRGNDDGRWIVAVDLVSAAQGQLVFYVRSREAASAMANPENPADAAILGIVDEARETRWTGPPGGDA